MYKRERPTISLLSDIRRPTRAPTARKRRRRAARVHTGCRRTMPTGRAAAEVAAARRSCRRTKMRS